MASDTSMKLHACFMETWGRQAETLYKATQVLNLGGPGYRFGSLEELYATELAVEQLPAGGASLAMLQRVRALITKLENGTYCLRVGRTSTGGQSTRAAMRSQGAEANDQAPRSGGGYKVSNTRSAAEATRARQHSYQGYTR